MPIVFLEKNIQARKKTIFLLVIFVVIVLLTWFVIQKGILKLPQISKEISKPRPVEIDFSVLESPQLKELQPLEEVPSIEKEKVGRENPFVPYLR